MQMLMKTTESTPRSGQCAYPEASNLRPAISTCAATWATHSRDVVTTHTFPLSKEEPVYHSRLANYLSPGLIDTPVSSILPHSDAESPITLALPPTLAPTVQRIQPLQHKPPKCGEKGNFTLNWDGPGFETGKRSRMHYTRIVDTIHHLQFQAGYMYGTAPTGWFAPISPPNIAFFFPNASNKARPNARDGPLGVFGASAYAAFATNPRVNDPALWFNFHSGYFGCENEGPEPCRIIFAGYQWTGRSGDHHVKAISYLLLPACSDGGGGCGLQYHSFHGAFDGVSGVQILAYVSNEQRAFFMDDLSMGWYDNSCRAGLKRARTS